MYTAQRLPGEPDGAALLRSHRAAGRCAVDAPTQSRESIHFGRGHNTYYEKDAAI